MNPVVVDTSVAFKWLHPAGEDNVTAATDVLDAHEAGSILIAGPASLPGELTNALRFTRLGSDRVIQLVEKLGNYRLQLFPATSERLAEAVRLAYRHRLTIYDALFLQLAEELDCPLVTADRRAFDGIETDVEIRLL